MSECPTHFHRATNAFARIDRVRCSFPAWMLANLHAKVTRVSDPQSLLERGVSDRSPVIVEVGPRKRKP